MTSIAREDYVRALYVLEERSKITITALAQYLQVSKASASEMMHSLDADGLVHYEPYRPISLSKRGVNLAENLTFKHRTIETFLNRVLHVPKSAVHDEAHKLEHAISDDTARRMHRFLRQPAFDPHGKEIPRP